MGTIHHHAVLATTWDEKRVDALKVWIESREWRAHFLIGPAVMNGYITVALVPDGSKEWWDTSIDGDLLRAAFIERLKKDAHEDGSNPWDFVEVEYGELGTRVVTGNCLEPA